MTVYLVGAGPGDPGLLTRRGADLLARADVVVYDRLVHPSLLALARPGAELLDVGKRPADGSGGAGRQAEINRLLVERGGRGALVVRLKGGDPFLFGRGGEEAEALRAAGVDWEVVPGVTSALAVPASAGVPVTHRGLAASVTVVTGHVGTEPQGGGVDWEALAGTGGTLVILMGMATRDEIARRLMEAGRAPDTPVAVVQWGTTPRRQEARTTLAGLGQVELGSPSVVVVGPVAGLELGAPPPPAAGPLEGRVVAVTRPAAQARPLADALAAAGAHVALVPLLEITDPDDGGAALAEAGRRLGRADWVAFTSANAVERLFAHLHDARDLAGVRLAVVGRATADALAGRGLVADLVAEPESAAGLVAALGPAPAGGARVLWPRAAGGRDELATGLRAGGWEVDEVVAYRTVPTGVPDGAARRALFGADAVVLASPSAAAALAALRRADEPLPPVVAVGPVTAEAARSRLGAEPAEAASPALPDVVAAVAARLAGT